MMATAYTSPTRSSTPCVSGSLQYIAQYTATASLHMALIKNEVGRLQASNRLLWGYVVDCVAPTAGPHIVLRRRDACHSSSNVSLFNRTPFE